MIQIGFIIPYQLMPDSSVFLWLYYPPQKHRIITVMLYQLKFKPDDYRMTETGFTKLSPCLFAGAGKKFR